MPTKSCRNSCMHLKGRLGEPATGEVGRGVEGLPPRKMQKGARSPGKGSHTNPTGQIFW